MENREKPRVGRKTGKGRSLTALSAAEQEAIAEIRALRSSSDNALAATLIKHPARLIHHILHTSRGNVRLRISPIIRELGVEMRTMERIFVSEYRQTMAECQVHARLAFARWMLSIAPPTKTAAIASLLGYQRVQDFNRFFKRHIGQSPAEWGELERERIARQRKTSTQD